MPSSVVTGIAFDVAAGSMPRNPARSSIVAIPGVATSDRLVERLGKRRNPRHATRDLEIGCVVAVRARDESVLARAGRGQVVDRLAAAHHPRLGLHGEDLELAAFEDPLVRTGMLLEADVEPGLVTVERVRVLHHELADAQQAAAGTRLVAAPWSGSDRGSSAGRGRSRARRSGTSPSPRASWRARTGDRRGRPA